MPGVFDRPSLKTSRATDVSSVAFHQTDGVGIPESRLSATNLVSRLNTQPMRTPVNALPDLLRDPTHDLGLVWLAKSSPYGSFIHDILPVFPAHPDLGLRELAVQHVPQNAC